jgi:hypothetical protein
MAPSADPSAEVDIRVGSGDVGDDEARCFDFSDDVLNDDTRPREVVGPDWEHIEALTGVTDDVLVQLIEGAPELHHDERLGRPGLDDDVRHLDPGSAEQEETDLNLLRLQRRYAGSGDGDLVDREADGAGGDTCTDLVLATRLEEGPVAVAAVIGPNIGWGLVR